jgi:HEAT repeat protein
MIASSKLEQGSTTQERLLAAWALAQQGLPAAAELMQLSQHPASAVRYWSAVGLANASLDAHVSAAHKENLLTRITELTRDADPAVSIAACEALVRLQAWDRALPPLERWLLDERETIRYRAIAVLDRPLPESKIPYAVIRKIYPQLGEYSQRVAKRILATEHP